MLCLSIPAADAHLWSTRCLLCPHACVMLGVLRYPLQPRLAVRKQLELEDEANRRVLPGVVLPNVDMNVLSDTGGEVDKGARSYVERFPPPLFFSVFLLFLFHACAYGMMACG